MVAKGFPQGLATDVWVANGMLGGPGDNPVCLGTGQGMLMIGTLCEDIIVFPRFLAIKMNLHSIQSVLVQCNLGTFSGLLFLQLQIPEKFLFSKMIQHVPF
jgi:hypothetical protein